MYGNDTITNIGLVKTDDIGITQPRIDGNQEIRLAVVQGWVSAQIKVYYPFQFLGGQNGMFRPVALDPQLFHIARALITTLLRLLDKNTHNLQVFVDGGWRITFDLGEEIFEFFDAFTYRVKVQFKTPVGFLMVFLKLN